MSGEPLVTVAVVPRERFSSALAALETLYASTREPYRLIYVDGGSPPRVRRALERASRERGFRLLRTPGYLSPNRARNLALREVTTRYVVFIDNDAFVTPGWLEALVRCAETTGAALCAPLTLIGPLEHGNIHVASGECRILREGGRNVFVDVHHHSGDRLSQVRASLHRCPTEIVEFHCMLARRETLEKLGPLDEGLSSLFEHCDLSLSVRRAGGALWFEPESVVAYHPATNLRWSDLRYFNLRWSDPWNRASLARFQEKWQLDPDSPGIESALGAARFQQRLMFRRARHWSHRALGPAGDPLRRALLRSERTLRSAVARLVR